MNRTAKVMGILLSVTAVFSVSRAQMGSPPSPQQEAEKALKIRQGLFEVQAFSFGPVGAMLKGAPFDAAAAQKAAARVIVTAGLIPEVFKVDTRKFQLQTKARENIWTQPTDFAKKASDLQSAAEQLESLAKAGDRAAALKAAAAVGEACKSCHDDFREK
jgi:cytochrome c556